MLSVLRLNHKTPGFQVVCNLGPVRLPQSDLPLRIKWGGGEHSGEKAGH